MTNPKDKIKVVNAGGPANKLLIKNKKVLEPKTPAYFTQKENGEWLYWNFGKINPSQLHTKYSKTITETILSSGKTRSYKIIKINHIRVHSLLFPTLNSHKFVRWDAQNGWTGVIDY